MPPKKAGPAPMPVEGSVEAKYKKHELRDHIYELPDTYIGSVESVQLETFVFDDTEKKMLKKTINFVPGLYKIYDEIIVNALDHCVRLKAEVANGKEDIKPVRNIRVNIDKESGRIEVMNDGDGIDVEMHQVHKVHVPQLIFGELLTSTNYDQTAEKLWSGRNGYGAKATNIFSKEFLIETIDHRRRKIYSQRFYENMKNFDKPSIKACQKVPYTKISFVPDYQRFGMEGMTEDIYELFRKRAYDACATTDPQVSVYFNDEKIDIKSFERYVDLYIGGKSALPRAFETINDRWEIAACCSDTGSFEQVSFVNGIATIRGGKHTDAVVAQIIKKLSDKTKKDVNAKHIKDNLMLFVKCLVVNPSFDTQTKEQLTTPVAKFGSKFEISDKFITALIKTGIVDKAAKLTEFHDKKSLSKTDGKKTCRVFVENLDDANWAGTKNSTECTLILTEGLSAKTMAVSGLSVVGRDKYGVFPLRGKILNVKDVVAKRIADNEEITSLKKILGLQQGKEYADTSELRYGSIMIMTDADHDGSHIKGLLFNLFQSQWPSLYKQDGFITSMLTPIVKVSKSSGETISFYNLQDFEVWQQSMGIRQGHTGGWKIRYLKGLGTSSEMEAKEYFRDMKRLLYRYTDGSDEGLDLAFNKKRADDRKSWLMKFDRSLVLDVSDTVVTYEDFVDKELIHFSNRDIERSINHMCDGLKESTRKILYGCFKRKLYGSSVKVAQLAAYVSEKAGYHHGETSLQQAIVGMAQVYVGANNINLLTPEGQFGTRLNGGKDAASPRYIFTQLSPLARLIFKEEDLPILKYQKDDDGNPIEPEYYIPIIPMVAVNGAIGIATGFSTNVPNHNPDDIINLCETIAAATRDTMTAAEAAIVIDALDVPEPSPWYLGYKGTIALHKPGVYQSRGCYTWLDDTTMEITELPIGTWTDDFKAYLLAMLSANNPLLKDIETHSTAKNVRFLLKFYPGTKHVVEKTFETDFNMADTKQLNLNNMHLFGENGAVHKYSNMIHVTKEWSKVRLAKYAERKEYQLAMMEYELLILSAKVRFIQEIIDKKLDVMNVKYQAVEGQLSEGGYPLDTLPPLLTQQSEHANNQDTNDTGSYNYLTRMPISQLTAEKKATLERQQADLTSKMQTLRDMTIQQIWLGELSELRKEWATYKQVVLDEYEADKSASPVAPKKKTVRAPKKK